ncbi:MAG TPA: ABC transporter permease, partial [Thermoanaerobaculia bacterium]|nr:ABC transporter permease [Thermoanaerobaculia bacterium]
MSSDTYSTSSLLIHRTPWWKLPRLRRWFAKVTFHLGGIGVMTGRLVKEVRGRWEWGEILRQMDALGVQSIAITNLTALFTGMVLALQTAYALAQFGGKL